MPSEKAVRIGLLQVSLAAVLWGTGGLVVQLLRRQVPMSVLAISSWRTGLAAVSLVVLLVALRQLSGVRILLRTHPGYAVLVGVLTAAYQVAYFGAVVNAGVAVATVVSLGLAPVLLTVAEGLSSRRRLPWSSLVVLLAAVAGLLLVSLSAGASATGPHPVAGIVLATGSGTAYALATACARPLAQTVGPLALTTATTGVGAVVLLPLGIIAGGGRVHLGQPKALLLLGYLGVMTMALAYCLLYAGLRTTPASAAVTASLLEPVTAVVVAALFLSERLQPAGVLGIALVLVAVAGLGRRPPVQPL